MAVEKAAGEPMADVESRVASRCWREESFPRDIVSLDASEYLGRKGKVFRRLKKLSD